MQVGSFSRKKEKRQCQSPVLPIIESLTHALKRIVKSTAKWHSDFTAQFSFQVLHRDEFKRLACSPLVQEPARFKVQKVRACRLVDDIVTAPVRLNRVAKSRIPQRMLDQVALPVIEFFHSA